MVDLQSFLAEEAHAAAAPLDVGHSKGGALATAVALWLKDALASPDTAEQWDGRRGPACHATRSRRGCGGWDLLDERLNALTLFF